jgi:hypothetical protein
MTSKKNPCAAGTAHRAGKGQQQGRHISPDSTVVQGPNRPVLAAALAYAARGWHVFPVPVGTKKSFKSAQYSNGRRWGATTDPAEIKRNWRRWPSANIGVATGEVSGIFLIDADTAAAHGVDGLASLQELEAKHGPLPLTLMARTPSGGEHRIFRYPNSGIKIKNSASEIAPGLDCRGSGGMFVAPPSVKGDAAYEWINDAPIADAPQWLLDLIVELPCVLATEAPLVPDDPEFEEEIRSRSGMGVDPAWVYEPATLEEVRAALSVVSGDDYYDWLYCGAALFHEFGEGGRDLFFWWSATSPKFDAAQCEAKWDECKKLTEHTVATIFHLANQSAPDWRLQVKFSTPEPAPIQSVSEETPPKPTVQVKFSTPEVAPIESAGEKTPAATRPKPTVQVRGTAKPPTLADLTHNMRDLRTMTFDPLQFIVPNYIPEGLTALGGRPKIGKSWLGLDASIAVATGSMCLGQTCAQGDVLGLFLEDSNRRLQRRMTTMLGAQKQEWPERFTYATAWPRMSAGGLLLLREWIKSVKNPRLIIIDILQKFRDLTRARQQASQYEAEYSALSKLQEITTEIAGLGILVLLHQRKQGADDPIDTISGTLGVGGAIDTFAILEKDTLGFRLYGRGRDLGEYNISVERDQKCRWQNRGARTVDAPVSTERANVIAALAKSGKPMTVEEIAMAVGRPGDKNIRNLLLKMHNDGEIERPSWGKYQLQGEMPF